MIDKEKLQALEFELIKVQAKINANPADYEQYQKVIELQTEIVDKERVVKSSQNP